MTHLLALLIASSHAGLLTDWCMRRLVIDDPYAYEGSSLSYLTQEMERLCIRRRWRALEPLDQALLTQLSAELSRRAAYGSDEDREAADLVLIRCAQ